MQYQTKIPYGDKQIRYKHYMYAHGLKDGDYHDVTGFTLWMSRHIEAFRKSKGLEVHASFTANDLQDEFTQYLKECAEVERRETEGQINIFEFL